MEEYVCGIFRGVSFYSVRGNFSNPSDISYLVCINLKSKVLSALPLDSVFFFRN